MFDDLLPKRSRVVNAHGEPLKEFVKNPPKKWTYSAAINPYLRVLVEFMKRKNILICDLCRVLGYCDQTVMGWFKNRYLPRVDAFISLANALGFHVVMIPKYWVEEPKEMIENVDDLAKILIYARRIEAENAKQKALEGDGWKRIVGFD